MEMALLHIVRAGGCYQGLTNERLKSALLCVKRRVVEKRPQPVAECHKPPQQVRLVEVIGEQVDRYAGVPLHQALDFVQIGEHGPSGMKTKPCVLFLKGLCVVGDRSFGRTDWLVLELIMVGLRGKERASKADLETAFRVRAEGKSGGRGLPRRKGPRRVGVHGGHRVRVVARVCPGGKVDPTELLKRGFVGWRRYLIPLIRRGCLSDLVCKTQAVLEPKCLALGSFALDGEPPERDAGRPGKVECKQDRTIPAICPYRQLVRRRAARTRSAFIARARRGTCRLCGTS